MNGLAVMVRGVARLMVLLVVGLAVVACQSEGPAEALKPVGVGKRFGAEPVTLTLTLDRERLTVAEQLTVELRAEVGEEYAVRFSERKDFPGFSVVSVKEPTPELIGPGRIAVMKRYVLDPLIPGNAQIPAMSVDAWKKADNEAIPITVTTEPVAIAIESLLAKDDQGDTISDIAPPLEKPVSPWLWGGLVLAALCVVLACWYLWQRWRRRSVVPPPPLPPHRVAYLALDRLIKGNLLAEGQITAFYQALSDIIRHYIEQRFGLRAPERTTEEFLTELGAVGVGLMANPAHKLLLRDFLTHCDLVKFACHTPATSEADEAVELCRRFIRETEPSPSENEGGGSA